MMYYRFFSFYEAKSFIDNVGGKLVRWACTQTKSSSTEYTVLYLNFK